MKTEKIKGQVAIVSGGTRGIGKAIVQKLSQNGAKLVINYNSDNSETAAEELKKTIENDGGEAIIVKGNVSNFEEAGRIVEETVKAFDKVDILVNNAGITKDTLILKMKPEDFDSVINVNLKGTFNMTKQVYKPMMKQKSGRIINISSVIGLVGNAGQANYAASKAGILGLTKSTALELGSRGITVNAVCPGFIKTSMTDQLKESTVKSIEEKIPMKMLGEPEDVANLVLFLASNDAKYITGQAITVDGGMVMR